MIIGVTHNYYILTCQYKCKRCKDKKDQLQRQANATAAAAGEAAVQVKLKSTFMGWDPVSVPLTAYGCGDQFPALPTWKARVDKTLLDMMRAEFDKGTRPEAFSNMVLELHAKEHVQSWLRYENEYSFLKKKYCLIDGEVGWDEFSSFDDGERWNDTVPTGRYFSSAYQKYSESIRCHLNKEVKKRGAVVRATDVSYKEARNICQHQGKLILSGLATLTNEIGEVQLQYHEVSDSHDQFVTQYWRRSRKQQESMAYLSHV